MQGVLHNSTTVTLTLILHLLSSSPCTDLDSLRVTRHRLFTPHFGSKPHLYLCVSLKPHQRDVARRVLCCFALRASRLNRAVEYVQVSAQRKYSQLHMRVMVVVGQF